MTSVDRIQGLSGSLAVKPPCRVATTANIALSGEQTIDGVAVVDGDRVLVKDQNDTTENGIYDASTGTWTRALDFDGVNDVKNGTLVYVAAGTANADLVYRTTGTDPITPGTSAITFTGSVTFTTISAFIATLLDDANATTALSTLGLTANGKSLVTAADYAAMKALLDLEIGTDVQAQDATLTALAALTLTQGGLLTMTGADTPAILAKGTARQILRMNAGATAPAWDSQITLGTPQASTSGTAIDFTGIPAGVRKITINLSSVGTNGTSPMMVQLGDAGGFESANYAGGVIYTVAGGATAGTNLTSGFLITNVNVAANTYSGTVTLTLENSTAFTWAETGSIANDSATAFNQSAGAKSLSAELTQVRITMVNGTDAFDAGEINITYE